MQAPAPRKFVPRPGQGAQVVLPMLSQANHALPSGPTVLLEDSQFHPTPMGSQVPGGGARPARARTIVLTPEAEAEALQLTNEGKITAKNAWQIKLLEGIQDSVSHALSLNGVEGTGGGVGALAAGPGGVDDSSLASQFTKCANLVEGGAKIWTHRVEHTAAWSTQVLRRLQRNDDKNTDGEGGETGEDGAAAGGESKKPEKSRRKVERTVAESFSEINMDEKTRALTFSQSGGISAQFRAITEKFEQGNAQGLLLNNAPMGSAGNLILDIDYAKLAAIGAAEGGQSTLGGSIQLMTTANRNGTVGQSLNAFQHAVSTHQDRSVTAGGTQLPPHHLLGGGSPSKRPRMSTAALAHDALSPDSGTHRASSGHVKLQDDMIECVEDAAPVVLEPPGALRSWGSVGSNVSASELASRGSGRGRGSKNAANTSADDLYVSNVQTAAPLNTAHLVVPPAPSIKVDESWDVTSPRASQRFPAAAESSGATRDGSTTAALDGRAGSEFGGVAGAALNFDEDDEDAYADMGGDGDAYDDDDDENNHRSWVSRSRSMPTSRAGSSVRDLVSGAAELAYFDTAVLGGGADQLAIAADNPNTWFPMSQMETATAPFQRNVNGGGLLDKIRKEKQQQLQASQQTTSSQSAAGGTQQPPKKRSRAEKQVLFIDDGIDAFLAPSDVTTIAVHENKLMGPRRENLKRPIADFRPRFLYRSSCDIANEHHLLLPDVSLKGALPWWLPVDAATSVASFFQPFSTSNLNWNILNKRVTTMEDAMRLTVAGGAGRPSAKHGAALESGGADGAPDGLVHEMPLHVFDDESGFDGGFDDGAVDDDDDAVGANGYAANFDLAAARNSLGTMFNQFATGDDTGDAEDAVEALNPDEHLDIMERPETLAVLQTNHATIPTQVDVVRLRRVMWQQMQRVLQEKPSVVMVPADEAGHTSHLTFGKPKRQGPLKRDREEEPLEASGQGQTAAGSDGYVPVALHRFSEVVAGVLVHAASISATGTLSPAFLFFSLLFLTNEHGIQLENVPGDVQDVYIRGLIGEGTLPSLNGRPSTAAH